MKSLADMLVDQKPLPAEIEVWCAKVRKVLTKPFDWNHIGPVHSCLTEITANEAQSMASQFVFDDKAYGSVINIIKDPKSFEICISNCRIPSDRTWYEFKNEDEDGTYGQAIYAEKLANGDFELISFIMTVRGDVIPYNGIRFNLNGELIEHINLHVNYLKDITEEEEKRNITRLLRDFVGLSAILNFRGNVEITRQRDQSSNRLRKLRKKLPLFSFNTVKLKIGPRDQRMGLNGAEGIGAHRFHDVVGYIRISRHNSSEPFFIWVAPHWRGDRDLGTIVKRREVELT